jgi:hypothetical protein
MKLITIIEFKSNRFVFKKEISGIKNNTVRIISQKEDEKIRNKLNEIKYIRIVSIFDFSGSLHQDFIRPVKDITRYVQKNVIIYIFTWEV